MDTPIDYTDVAPMRAGCRRRSVTSDTASGPSLAEQPAPPGSPDRWFLGRLRGSTGHCGGRFLLISIMMGTARRQLRYTPGELRHCRRELGDHARLMLGQLSEKQDLTLEASDPLVVLDGGR